MNIKMFLILFLFSIGVSFLYGQARKEQIIPIIGYNPHNFDYTVRTAFSRLPHTDYIKIGLSKTDQYYINLGDGESPVKSQHFPLTGIPELLSNDSLFLFYFIEGDWRSAHQNRLELKYYGFLDDGNVYFKKVNNNSNARYILSDIIKEEFGSIEKYKEMYVENIKNAFENNIRNGIIPLNKDSAYIFLRNDYGFYSECFPDEKDKAMDMFIDFINKSISCNDIQKEKIKQRIYDDADRPSSENILYRVKYYNPYYKVEIWGRDIAYILLNVLTENQYKQLINDFYLRNNLYRLYRYGPFLKTQEPLDNIGYVRYLTRDESFSHLKKEVFGK